MSLPHFSPIACDSRRCAAYFIRPDQRLELIACAIKSGWPRPANRLRPRRLLAAAPQSAQRRCARSSSDRPCDQADHSPPLSGRDGSRVNPRRAPLALARVRARERRSCRPAVPQRHHCRCLPATRAFTPSRQLRGSPRRRASDAVAHRSDVPCSSGSARVLNWSPRDQSAAAALPGRTTCERVGVRRRQTPASPARAIAGSPVSRRRSSQQTPATLEAEVTIGRGRDSWNHERHKHGASASSLLLTGGAVATLGSA